MVVRMGRRRGNAISVVEAAYETERTDEHWLRAVLDAAELDFPENVGTGAYLYDAATTPIRIGAAIGRGRIQTELLQGMVATADDAYVEATWRSIAFGTASQGEGFDEIPAVRQVLHPRGIRDILALNAYDPSGLGVWVGAALAEKSSPTAAAIRTWSRIAVHLAAAFRLRRREVVTEAAILTPRGKLEHAEGDAKQATAATALRAAVVSMDRARGALRREDPREALEIWKGLVRARWTLLDRFDRDGKRYVVAVENRSDLVGPDALAPRELQVVALVATGSTPKLIAYDLGISDSTVRVLISRAMAKLGVSTRADLVAVYRAYRRS